MDAARASRCPENKEQPIHPLFGYLYVTDREEGLILVGAAHTLLDGNPLNNFLKRAVTFNPDGLLNGATSVAIAGTYAYRVHAARPRGRSTSTTRCSRR